MIAREFNRSLQAIAVTLILFYVDAIDMALLEEGETAFREVLELSTGEIQSARYYSGDVLTRRARLQEARAEYEEFLALQPKE